MSYQPKLFTLPAPESDLARSVRYEFSERTLIALDVARATGRPLLVSGDPGTGKTVLAKAISKVLGWRYLERVITSRTSLDDLTGAFDALRRLNDAQAGVKGEPLLPDWAYLEPGILWWAFDEGSARRRGGTEAQWAELRRERPERAAAVPAPVYPGTPSPIDHAVLLLDEIDKAEPDVPNDLLQPLDVDVRGFTVHGVEVCAPRELQLLVIITTNRERDLPPAFLRRCVALDMGELTLEHLEAVGGRHFGSESEALCAAVAKHVMAERQRLGGGPEKHKPSTSEFLDAVRTCLELGVRPGHRVWNEVSQAVLAKEGAG